MARIAVINRRSHQDQSKREEAFFSPILSSVFGKSLSISGEIRHLVWTNYFGNKETGLCPSCHNIVISERGGEIENKLTERFNIGRTRCVFPNSDSAPTNFKNLLPVCPLCSTTHNSSKENVLAKK